jgi:hypothetical protein
MTIFDFLKHLTGDKKSWSSFTEDEQTQFNPYMVHRFVSMYEPYTEIANIAQRIPYTEKEKTYKFYQNMLPKKQVFLKYIKSSKTKINDALLKHVSKFYECSLGEAEEYVYLLRREGLEHLLGKIGLEDKEIKKLLKEIK